MYNYKIKLERVVDGDTIDANIDLGFDVSVKKRIRFNSIKAFKPYFAYDIICKW